MNVTDPTQPGAEREPRLRIDVNADADRTLVVPRGELDITGVPELEAVLMTHTGRVVVDLRHLTFVDATGLRVLLEAEARSRQDGMNLRFVPGSAVRRVIAAAGVPDELTYDDGAST